MKNHLLKLSLLFVILITFSCNSQKKSEEVASYTYEEKSSEINPEILAKVGDWVKEDAICYGLVVAIDKKGVPVRGKSVKAKVVNVQGNDIKMKSLENISIAAKQGCNEYGIKIGESWVEKDGELFETREEADNYLKSKDLLMED